MGFVVNKVVLGLGSIRVFRFYPAIVIPQFLAAGLNLTTALIRRTNGSTCTV